MNEVETLAHAYWPHCAICGAPLAWNTTIIRYCRACTLNANAFATSRDSDLTGFEASRRWQKDRDDHLSRLEQDATR